MSREIVHNDDIAWDEFGNEHLLDISSERLAVHRSVDDHGCGDAAEPQTGSHRCHLPVTVRHGSAATFASRGQARTIALALKHGEGHLVSESTGRSAVLALDDVLSELDEKRRRLVLEAASEYEQVLLSTTDFSAVQPEFLADAETFTVEGGAPRRVSL